MKHPSHIKNNYDFVDRIPKLVIPEEWLLITLDIVSMYTNIDHAKEFNAMSEALQFWGPLFDGIMQLTPWIIIKK